MNTSSARQPDTSWGQPGQGNLREVINTIPARDVTLGRQPMNQQQPGPQPAPQGQPPVSQPGMGLNLAPQAQLEVPLLMRLLQIIRESAQNPQQGPGTPQAAGQTQPNFHPVMSGLFRPSQPPRGSLANNTTGGLRRDKLEKRRKDVRKTREDGGNPRDAQKRTPLKAPRRIAPTKTRPADVRRTRERRASSD